MQQIKWLGVVGALVFSISVLAHPQYEGRSRIDAVMAAPLVAQYGPPGHHFKHHARGHKAHKRWRHHARKERHLKRKIRRLRHKLARERERSAYFDGYYAAPRIIYPNQRYGSGVNLKYHDDAGSYQLRYRSN